MKSLVPSKSASHDLVYDPQEVGLLHSVFYIQRYGSPYNVFGGFCESHLKWLVKGSTKKTSRQQDRLHLDLMNR
jgi:hypothetical protein